MHINYLNWGLGVLGAIFAIIAFISYVALDSSNNDSALLIALIFGTLAAACFVFLLLTLLGVWVNREAIKGDVREDSYVKSVMHRQEEDRKRDKYEQHFPGEYGIRTSRAWDE